MLLPASYQLTSSSSTVAHWCSLIDTGGTDWHVAVSMPRALLLMSLLLLYARDVTSAVVAAAALSAPPPAGPEPPQYANLSTSSIFWPGDVDDEGVVYPCTYIPTLCLANGTRLVAHGMCATNPRICNHVHLSRLRSTSSGGGAAGIVAAAQGAAAAGAGAQWAGFCQKHSDDGGKSWSPIRKIVNQTYPLPGASMQLGMIVWDTVHEALLLQYPSPDVHQITSTDLGASWSSPRNLSAFLAPVFVNDKPDAWLNVGPGAAIQLSAKNRFHPHRLIFAGHYGNYEYVAVWWSDDGGRTYELAKDKATGQPLKLLGQNEPALAEVPDGGVLVTSRNEVFHGYVLHVLVACVGWRTQLESSLIFCALAARRGKCNCRGSARSLDGGETFSQPQPDPVLVEPICQGTMLGHDGAVFHANPGHGTPTENKGASCNWNPDSTRQTRYFKVQTL